MGFLLQPCASYQCVFGSMLYFVPTERYIIHIQVLVPFIVNLFLNKEFRRRKSIRLDRKLRNAIERKKKAIFYDEDEELQESEKEINDLEKQIKSFEEEISSKNKRATLYASKKMGMGTNETTKTTVTRNNNDINLNRVNSTLNLSQQLIMKEKRNSFNNSTTKQTRNGNHLSKPSGTEVRVSFNLDNIERPSKKAKPGGKRVSPKI